MKHILLVDDSVLNLKVAAGILRDSYKVSVVKSGEQALQFLQIQIPDLILLDINMPDMDGFETITYIKKDEKTQNIPVIFLTASHDSENEVRGFELGAVDFITKPFTPESMMLRIETQLELSSYRKELEKKIEEKTNHILVLEDSIIRCFCEMIECHDNETGGHIMRTVKYVKILARELSKLDKYKDIITDEYIHLLARSAPLHDIGKIGIRDNILLKQSRLDNSEYAKIKEHTIIGARMLENIIEDSEYNEYLNMGKDMALSHHERYDGKGYPYGIAGDDIPLCARIMAVADVYDALVSKRIYKDETSHITACATIAEGRGTQFDPDVVDVFLRVEKEFEKIVDKLRDDMIKHSEEDKKLGI